MVISLGVVILLDCNTTQHDQSIHVEDSVGLGMVLPFTFSISSACDFGQRPTIAFACQQVQIEVGYWLGSQSLDISLTVSCCLL